MDFKDAPSWKTVKMKDIAINNNGIVDGPFGSNLKTTDYINDSINGIPVLTTKNLNGDFSDKSVRYISKDKFDTLKRSAVFPGDILVAKIGSIGKCCIYPPDQRIALIPANLLKITLREEYYTKYVYYFIQSPDFQALIRSITKATAQPAFNVTRFRELPISVPCYTEQLKTVQKIEESLSQLDSAVETLKKTKQQLEVYRQAVIENAISDGKTNSANSVPFGDLVLRYQNGISKRSGKGIETPVLRLADIDNQQIVAGKGFRYIGLTDIERLRFLLNAGDLLIIRVNGSENNVGRSIVVQEDKRYTACDHFIRCQVDRDRVLPEYAQLLLDSYPSRKHIKDNMVSTAGQNTVSQSTMSNIPVYVPSVELQKSILLQVNERLSNCEFIQNTIEESLSQAEALRQSILKQAFEEE